MLALLLVLLASPPVVPIPLRAAPVPGGTLVAEARGLRFFNTRLDLFHLFPTVEGVDGARVTLKIEAEGTQGWQWVSVVDTPDGLVALLDWQVESSGPTALVLTSRDGRRWVEEARIEKPHYFGQIQGFLVDGRRVVGVTLRLDDCADCGVALGSYVARRGGPGQPWRPFVRVGPSAGQPGLDAGGPERGEQRRQEGEGRVGLPGPGAAPASDRP
ncbi:MAG: hypothetical protein H6706_26025 [Myxococcales bacterium]|nr:hypothetical protein [Myxococcales bacterium]